ncbi:MAG: phosphoglucosamine mutase [Euryarchaeota archaeon]|nr:phosphoglucosamine mutase [Euryarchaeota archaeon]
MTQTLQWFGSSGIRGPLETVDVELALRLGRAVGHRWDDLVVGRDARLSGPALEAAFIAGALSSGARITRLGTVPTPAVAWAARHHALGVQVTASHNPAPDNGFKLWTPSGSAVPHDALFAIENDMEHPPPLVPYEQVGLSETAPEALDRYIDAVLSHVGTDALAGMHIALDCAHGAGALATPRILARLGARLRVLGGAPDGRFPDHPSEPVAEHLEGLIGIMRSGGHDLGLAHDGDADRTVLLHPDGSLIEPVRLLTVIAEVRGDDKVALPIDASGVFADTHPDKEVVVTPVGDIHLSRALETQGATAACEPSGTWFFSDWSPAPEGPAAAAYLAALIADDPAILERVAALPEYQRRTHKHRWSGGLGRSEALERVMMAADRAAEGLGDVTRSDVDGVRLDSPDGWLLIRPSGTEPVVRVTAEAQSADRSDTLLSLGRKAVEAHFGEAA